MIDQPYTMAAPSEVNPGDRIWYDGKPIEVDEVRRGSDGYTMLCYPTTRVGSGRRSAVLFEIDDEVFVLANGEEDHAILQELTALVQIGNQSAGEDRWGIVDHGQMSTLRVLAEGRLWDVPIPSGSASTPTPPPPAPDAPVDEEAPGA